MLGSVYSSVPTPLTSVTADMSVPVFPWWSFDSLVIGSTRRSRSPRTAFLDPS
jgi:hypothetical protein